MWHALYASLLHREVGSDEALYVLRPKSQNRASAAKTNDGQPRIAARRMISHPRFRHSEERGNLFQCQQGCHFRFTKIFRSGSKTSPWLSHQCV